ncbi:dipeptidyl aminopeptidase BII [Flavobacteriaceae bacterium UJ101]|nr:dipeptidyl aminopeptidase BII [Flavobacteriaceae bacterium UJ101]
MNRKIIISVLLLLSGSLVYSQKDGGMWQPQKLEANKKEMRKLGAKLKPSEIYNEEKSSLKDAIVHFNRGCTAEIISPEALLLTNHHCGYGQIQAHSTVENDLLKNGFWAKNNKEELKNEKLTATFIVSIKDVTEDVLRGVSSTISAVHRNMLIDNNIRNVQELIKKEPWQDVEIKPFYKGNEYYAFITETFRDVRLVGAPPQSIGKFGSDTDNWMWPRHSGDFALFRIYADQNNRPADYSESNVPYKPKHFLPINVGGIEEGDFTMVFGFPGRTNEYLPASAIKQVKEVINPARIEIRETALNILDKEMRKDDATRIKYASKYARTANYWKKWKGENLGLEKSKAILKKEKYEWDFLKKAEGNTEYVTVLPKMENLYEEIEPYTLAKVYFDEVVNRNSESFKIALKLLELLQVKKYKSNEYEKIKMETEAYLKRFYKDYNGTLDLDVTKALYKLYSKNVPEDLQSKEVPKEFNIEEFKNSIIPTNQVLDLFGKDDNLFAETVYSDPIVQLVNQLVISYYSNSAREYTKIRREIDQLQGVYMKAQKELMDERRFYPDANSTLRVTYGQVQGYQPEKGKRYEPKTYLSGVMKKYIPGDYEFDVSEKLQKLYADKDYGIYADKKGRMPVNFIATNHTTGGNSGSPALDAKGNLIGLNFDRVWEGTMSDLNYDPKICRNIMVDARYILFIIDKYGDAGYLIDEMKLVD